MRHYYLVFLFLFFHLAAQAQETGIEEEIMAYSETKSELISKGRRLLRDKLIEGDLAKVREIKDYLLNEVQDEDYIALHPGEQWMLMYWTGELEKLPQSITQLDYASLEQWYQGKIIPEPDMLYRKIIEKSWDQLQMLEDRIIASPLKPEDKDFLLLHLNFMVSGEPLMKMNQETVNDMADLYLETHPGSSYEEYIRNNIRFKFAPSKWGLGFEFFSGYGILTGELKEKFSNNIPIGIDFDVEYERYTLFLRAYIGLGTLPLEREIDGVVWPEGAQTRVYLPEASLGYAVMENDRVRISPYLGIGAASVSPTDYDLETNPELEVMEVGFSTAYTVGLNFNIKLGWEVAPYLTMQEDKSYWFIRVRYGYTMPQFNNFPGNTGNFHHITLGLGGIYRGMKRAL